MSWLQRAVIGLCLTCLLLPVSAQDRIRVRVSDLPPLTYQDAKGNWVGLDVELAKVVLLEAGLTPVYQSTPWKRALAQMETGELDLMVNLSITEERKKFLHFFGPSRDEAIVLVVPKDSNYVINSLDDFLKLPGKVGIQLGSYYGSVFDARIKSDAAFAAKFDMRPGSDMNIQKLESDRISGFLAGDNTIRYSIKTDPAYANVRLHSFVISHDPVYFGIAKKSVSAEVIQRLEQAYTRAKASGKLDAVAQRYR